MSWKRTVTVPHRRSVVLHRLPKFRAMTSATLTRFCTELIWTTPARIGPPHDADLFADCELALPPTCWRPRHLGTRQASPCRDDRGCIYIDYSQGRVCCSMVVPCVFCSTTPGGGVVSAGGSRRAAKLHATIEVQCRFRNTGRRSR